MIVKSGTYFGQPIILACDARCDKAWGIANRPRVYVQEQPQVIRRGDNEGSYFPDDETLDMDDYAFLADDELATAPVDPGSYEGDQGKPRAPEQRLNKWCCRACERCRMVDDKFPVKDFELPDFSQRQYNIAPHTRPKETA